MDNLQKIYCDIFCLHDKVHTYHTRTINMKGWKELHEHLGTIYEWLELNVDSFAENILVKYKKLEVPCPQECYDESEYVTNMSDNPDDIVLELYSDIEIVESDIEKALNASNNALAQLLGSIWEDFTNYCAILARQMDEEDE